MVYQGYIREGLCIAILLHNQVTCVQIETSLLLCSVTSGASWLMGSVRNLQGTDRRLEPSAGLNLLWRCAPGQGFYPPMHFLDPGVSRYLVGQASLLHVHLNSFQRRDGSRAVCSPGR